MLIDLYVEDKRKFPRGLQDKRYKHINMMASCTVCGARTWRKRSTRWSRVLCAKHKNRKLPAYIDINNINTQMEEIREVLRKLPGCETIIGLLRKSNGKRHY